MRLDVTLHLGSAALILTIGVGVSAAQSKSPQPKSQKTIRSQQRSLAEELSKSRAEVITATEDFKSSLEKLTVFIEREIKAADEAVQKRRELQAQGVVSKREVEEAERVLAEHETELKTTRRQIVEADGLIAEVKAAEELDKIRQSGTYVATAAVIRYSGSGKWSVSDATKLQSFYVGRFGVQLPVSAFGQTLVHDRMGYDHREAIDVAVHPDSPEGQALMGYLRGAGIPFLAFRHAVPGSATGAHIHVGKPSQRLAPPKP